ncbi:MAG: excinuclease ABC subunit UvrB [Candidatus Omnitrophica bacterium]|nr:excinuclease ABC subunit UvrB [Candidatus Omnitrophota bacterium]
MGPFKLSSPFKPQGDQPQAISKLAKALLKGNRFQILMGVTGSGKTFTMASIIAELQKPTLVISHNKTLAAQLYAEFKEFFPKNAVEYFISYYDYYQPESYIPQTDTYIEKDASINEKINRLRLAATTSLMTRKDVIVVASVSCIYNLGSPQEYRNMLVHLETGQKVSRDEILQKLVKIRYERNDIDFTQGIFRVRGDVVEVFPAYEQHIIRIEFFGDEIEKLSIIEYVSLRKIKELDDISIYPATHFLADSAQIDAALNEIESELKERLIQLKAEGRILEAARLESRTKYDMEMLKETGFCHGVENYSRHLSGRAPGSRPYCLLDYFGREFLIIIDESHVTVPQIRGMYNGDKARKSVLVDYGFRLPSCLDNRPLRFSEFEKIVSQVLFASATPAEYELEKCAVYAEQIIRPTGLVDPPIIVIQTKNQIDDLIKRIKQRASKHERVLVTTLTKRMAEDLCRYLQEVGLAVNYIHSELNALERIKIIGDLRKRNFDCLVGVNLLREGLDLPEVSLVCIMDADKEGFLRSTTSLIQLSGRAARNINGEVVVYADTITKSLKKALKETSRRRKKQLEYNKKWQIKPESIVKAVRDWIEIEYQAEEIVKNAVCENMQTYERLEAIAELEAQMEAAARSLQFEQAINLRDKIKKLKTQREK